MFSQKALTNVKIFVLKTLNIKLYEIRSGILTQDENF